MANNVLPDLHPDARQRWLSDRSRSRSVRTRLDRAVERPQRVLHLAAHARHRRSQGLGKLRGLASSLHWMYLRSPPAAKVLQLNISVGDDIYECVQAARPRAARRGYAAIFRARRVDRHFDLL